MNFFSLSLKQLLSFTDVKWRQQCLSYPLGEKERGGGVEGGSWEKGLEKKRKNEQREEGEGRGGEERMRMNILHFLAKIPQRVGKTMR